MTSRPEGREAALSALAYEPILKNSNSICIDFDGVAVMTPSWLSEFVQTLQEKGIKTITFMQSQNPTVKSSIAFIEPEIK